MPRGCPWPDLVLTAMIRLGVDDVRDTVVAHGMESGVLCGRRSGAGTVVGVLTGTHTTDRLRRAGATHVIGSVSALPDLLAAGSTPDASAPGSPSGPGAGTAGPPGTAGAAGAADNPAAQEPLERRSTGL